MKRLLPMLFFDPCGAGLPITSNVISMLFRIPLGFGKRH